MRQYLDRYAEPEARCLPGPHGYEHVVVIPACGEGNNLLDAVAAVPGPNTLVIVVLNGRCDAPSWVFEKNARSQRALEDSFGIGRLLHATPPMTLHPAHCGHILVIHRWREPHCLPTKQGVGLARKIGADVALQLMALGRIQSTWIHCTDADAKVPRDYFVQTRHVPTAATAVLYNFTHQSSPDPAVAWAINQYETSLEYYVRGLRYAGSPYAFHSLGSTIAVRGAAYAQVRGFPRRNAAEDFYFLDKIAKVGCIAPLLGEAISLSPRVSQRVPFGTGKAMWKLLCESQNLQLYHPETFVLLRQWLEVLAQATHGVMDLKAACDGRDRRLWPVAQKLAAADAVALAWRKTRSVYTRSRFLHTWFDAFRTLKFVHHVRDMALPCLPLELALQSSPFTIGNSKTTGAAQARLPSAPWHLCGVGLPRDPAAAHGKMS